MMEPYGCHNKPLHDSIIIKRLAYMSDGSVQHFDKAIEHTMTKECQWSKTHTSERCDGCSKKA